MREKKPNEIERQVEGYEIQTDLHKKNKEKERVRERLKRRIIEIEGGAKLR